MKTLSLTAEQARELFTYDTISGALKWRFRKGKKIRPDLTAGYIDHEGYRVVRVNGVNYRGHRICWLIQKGAWPANMLDHINGDRSDNRWCNLREATNAENQMNKKARTTGATGYKGVSIQRKSGQVKYMARLGVGGKYKFLGLFSTAEAAYEAYKEEARAVFGDYAKV